MESAVYLTVEEVVERYRGLLSEGTLRNWRSKRIGPSYLKLGKAVLYPRAELDQWDRANLVLCKRAKLEVSQSDGQVQTVGVSSHVTVRFSEPILYEGHPGSTDREFHIDLAELGIGPSGYDLIGRFNLPLVSHPSDLADWSREITEAEYLDLVGPPDIEALRAKHRGLRWRMEWRSEPGHENHYGQIERIFHLVSEFKRGNRALRYQLTVSDMG